MKLIISFISYIGFLLPILLTIAFFTLAERKVMGTIQRRKGPNVVGFGFLQPIADAIKLLVKEATVPSSSNSFIFFIAPLITIIISLFGWCIIPFNHTFIFSDIDLSILFFLAVSSLGVYGIILAG